MKLRELLVQKKVLAFSARQGIKDEPQLLAVLEKEHALPRASGQSVHDFAGLLALLEKHGVITKADIPRIDGF